MGKLFRVRKQRIFYLKKDDPLPTILSDINLSLMRVNAENVGRVTEFRDEEIAGKFEHMLQEGQLGLYAQVEGQVVAHAWAYVCRHNHGRVNGYFDLHQGQALIHNYCVAEPYRGHHICPALLVALCWQLYAQTRTSFVYIDSELDNVASLAGIARAGFKPYGIGRYYQFQERLLFRRIEYAA